MYVYGWLAFSHSSHSSLSLVTCVERDVGMDGRWMSDGRTLDVRCCECCLLQFRVSVRTRRKSTMAVLAQRGWMKEKSNVTFVFVQLYRQARVSVCAGTVKKRGCRDGSHVASGDAGAKLGGRSGCARRADVGGTTKTTYGDVCCRLGVCGQWRIVIV